jgi:2-polyprenyl-3-methyl-5-hydroxy-6-metoxy-1,4-benzoquinol methylase
MDPISYNSKAYPASRCGQNDIRVQLALPLIGKAGRVLDVGCLDGTIAELMVKMGNVVCGIDASEPAIKRAVARGIDARIGNVEEPFPFDTGFFDAIFAGEIIEHVFDVDAMLEEIRRVLKPGGSFVVTTPNLAAFGRRMLLLIGGNPHIEISFMGDAAGHIRYFIKGTLTELLNKHGFTVDVFLSDVVNFNASGAINSTRLARWFPTIGRSLIVRAIRQA